MPGRTVFSCSACGAESPKWHGRCPVCGDWNTLVEEPAPAKHAAGGGRRRSEAEARPVLLADVEAPAVARLETGIGELDRVLGGGVVPGSLVLIGGAPGIGKSTLAAAAVGRLVAAGGAALYVSGEESAAQVKLRAERLGEHALQVPILAHTELEVVAAAIESERPDVCVVDSVQALAVDGMSGAAGSVGQVREVTGRLMEVAKRGGTSVVLLGHVTKEGALAGPRVLEHMVDCVLQFEGERERTYRVLRALKNRFGSTNEVGVFEMREHGLIEVSDASSRFVEEATRAPGSVVAAAMEGSRSLLVEVQALVAPTEIAQPRRVANGVDRNRLALVLAVLARHARLPLASADVFVSAAGGVRVEEPGADLAIALAVASAARGTPLGANGRPLAAFGEVGLTGEVRYVAHPDRRSAEARKFGLAPILSPGEHKTALADLLAKAVAATEDGATPLDAAA
jgi:DNA repair protein RadA/Sms